MNLTDYQKICRATAKKFDNKELEIYTWGLGIAGEAGDVASCIKKTFAHENSTVQDGIRENLGDTLWYMAMICNYFGWDMQEVMQDNINKLKKRYPKGFTIEKAKREGSKIDWNE